MYDYENRIRRAAIGAIGGARSAVFGPGAGNIFDFGGSAPRMAGRRMGQTAQDFYNNAIPQIQKFDQLVTRTQKIANKASRDQIINDYGLNDPTNTDKAQYMRNALASDIANAQKYTPIAYEQGFPTHGPARGRVTKLQNFNADFEGAVKTAEDTYGILPEPVVIERVVTAPGAAMDYVPYVLVGGAAIAALFITGVIKLK